MSRVIDNMVHILFLIELFQNAVRFSFDNKNRKFDTYTFFIKITNFFFTLL